MFMISGTIHQAGKLAEMNMKWMEKQQNGFVKKEKDLTPEERQLKMFQQQVEENREANKYASIDAKIQSGATLSSEEIDYLKKNNPDALHRYEEMKKEKKAYERQLQNCKTKEDVERLKLQKVGQYLSAAKKISNNPCIPKGQKLGLLQEIVAKLTNIHEAHMKFVKSARYQGMPTDEELAEEKRETLEKLTGADEKTVGDLTDESVELTDKEQDMFWKTEGAAETDITTDETGLPVDTEVAQGVDVEVDAVDFSEAVHVIDETVRKLETDTYSRTGDGNRIAEDRNLGKRIDFRK